MLVTLENNWERWMDMVQSGDASKSKVKTKFTSTETEETASAFTNWTNDGMRKFNGYCDTIQSLHKFRKPVDKKFMDWWNGEAASNKKKPKRKASSGLVQARNSLFNDDDHVDESENDERNPFDGIDMSDDESSNDEEA